MRFATVCSGIEACSVAWNPLGWQPVFFSEIAPFPCALLEHYYPDVPNLGDMEKINGEEYRGTVDVVCGGTPCQSFSTAGKRAGMDDPRGNLALVYLRLAKQIRPRWVIWENVPGVLSSAGGADFGSFLWTLGQCGYGWSYRILDAQNWGVPQRRRRVFVVGHLGDWRCAAAVLFERESLRGDIATGKKAGHEVARTLRARPNSSHREDSETLITETARCLNSKRARRVRRLTPRECERLQGFPDDYTKIPYRGKPADECPDGPRYSAIGNSMAVPVMRWIGGRIMRVEAQKNARTP
jgi:DNA (cytosine-5)-methyltransferase 1